jgi:hypothetical protein
MRPLRASAILLAAVLLAACSPAYPPKPPAPTLIPQDPNGNFTLYITNESTATVPVDIAISFDGVRAIQDQFGIPGERRTPRSYVTYTFQLSPGKHRLTATAANGRTSVSQEFDITGKHWAALTYGASPKSLRLIVKDSPIGFD